MQASSKSNTLPKAKLRLRYFTPREVGAFLLHLLLFSPAPCLNRILVHSLLLLFHSYNCSFLSLQVANLHSFPEDFHFPQDVRLRQWYVSFKTLICDTSYISLSTQFPTCFCSYALLGNSLSVGVVAPLFSYLFTHS